MRVPLRQYWQLLARYLVPHRRALLLLAVLVAGGIGVQLLAPWLAARFLNTVTASASSTARVGGGGRFGHLIWLAALFCVAGVAGQLLSVVSTQVGSRISWQATNRLRTDLVEHCLRLDLGFHHDHGPGVMVERIDGDVGELNNFFAEFALTLVGNLMLIVGVLVVTLVVDWRIGTVFVAFTVVGLWIYSRVRSTAAPYWQRSRSASAALYGEVEERLGGLPDIRANGADDYVQQRFTAVLRRLFHRDRSARMVSALIGQGAEVVMALGAAAVLVVAAALFLTGAVPIGTVVAVSMYAAMIVTPLQQIMLQIDDLQRATASIARVRGLLNARPTIESGPGARTTDGAAAVVFDRVSFAYPQTVEPAWHSPDHAGTVPVALHEVSFRLQPGEVLGLVGRTGAGKSTIARLLLRFYDPTAGQVSLDGTDLRVATLDQLRSRVGVVTQDVQLFRATLRDNLTLFDDQVEDDRIEAALREIGMGDWLDRQPGQLDTMLAYGGGLSAGEAQLLGVARVFLANPGLVILDEPTSRLDPGTETLVQRAFDRLLIGRTSVLIAHRLHTLRRADSILVLADGRAVEYGDRARLAADPTSAFHAALHLASVSAAAATKSGGGR